MEHSLKVILLKMAILAFQSYPGQGGNRGARIMTLGKGIQASLWGGHAS